MNKAVFHQFAVRFNMPQWFGRKPGSSANPTRDTTATNAPACAQAANPSLYELLQLRVENQHTIAELADLERAIHQAFLSAYYRDSANVEIDATTAPTPPREGALEDLRGLLDANNCIHQKLTNNLAAFNRAWQAMAQDESATASMPNQVISYAEE